MDDLQKNWAEHLVSTQTLWHSRCADKEDLVGQGECELGEVLDGAIVATTSTTKRNKNCSPKLVVFGKQNMPTS